MEKIITDKDAVKKPASKNPAPGKNGWGGKRREGITKSLQTLSLSIDIIEVLSKLPNKSKFVNDLLEKRLTEMGLYRPKK
jgi:hypothetical protein